MNQNLFPFLIAALALLGCSDPMIGRWQSALYSDIDLDVRDGNDFAEYLADGHIYVCSGETCDLCTVNFQLKYAGPDRYDLQGQGDEQCATRAQIRGGAYCTLSDDGAELDCLLDNGNSILYEKIDD